MSKPTEELLELLFNVTVAELTERIKSGEAAAADLGVAVKLLKDNNITVDLNKSDSLQELKERLQKRKQGNVVNRQSSNVTPMTEEERQEAIDNFRIN